MHVFFESLWKLHIGEIPEKPHEFTDEIEQYDIWEEYRNKIAAIKQNALTVGNPEVIDRLYHGCPIADNQGFVKWYGGYETTCKWNGNKDACGNETCWDLQECQKSPTVAILTLPEEKKNTMENMTKEQQFNLPAAAVFNLQQIALADDDMVKAPGAAEKYRFIARHILELFAASGSVAAPKEEKSEDFGKLKWKVGQILAEQFLKYNDGKFIAAIELNPATHALTEFIESENTALREALKELLPIAERKFNATSHREYIALKAIIERARKLIGK